jgi:hypothetical protein
MIKDEKTSCIETNSKLETKTIHKTKLIISLYLLISRTRLFLRGVEFVTPQSPNSGFIFFFQRIESK